MIAAHSCAGCTRLFYPTPGPDAVPLRCDAVIVKLSPEMAERARKEGEGRARRHFTKKRRDKFAPLDRIENDVQAVGAEMAVAQLFGLPWTGGADLDVGGDVGELFVRWSRTRSMPIRPTDGARSVNVFVTGKLPVYVIRGWMVTADARRPEWYHDTPPAYYAVPLDELHDLRRLRRHFASRA